MKLCHFIFSLMKSVPAAGWCRCGANVSVSLSLRSLALVVYKYIHKAETLVGGE